MSRVTLVGGEPTMRPEIIQVFCEEMPRRLSLMKGNWGGIGTTPVQYPSWAILSLDHMGREKKPCCIGSADSKSLKPICEDCGLCLLLMGLLDKYLFNFV